jgi:adenosyl cobinamide kinase/adenosyl cobinamide phosphate guanylyltransferase
MTFVTGPLYSGKKEYVKQRFGWNDHQLAAHAVWDVQKLVGKVDDLNKLADRLADCEVVIATEVGGGIVPIDPQERKEREAAGRLSCLLAQRADTVIRVFCGLPLQLKGD